MTLRFLRILPILAAAVFAQDGIYGPISAEHPKAGDLAPDIVFAKVLNTGNPSPWTSANLFGKLTVITFYPDTSHNLPSVSSWNALVQQFRDKAIQFVWITGEPESSLALWLRNHPVSGWVFDDPDGATGRSYGMELPSAVIVGTDGRIIGFDPSMLPTGTTLNAALEGRITTTSPKPGAAGFKEFMQSNLVLLDAEAPRMPRPDDHKPNFAPSYTVHISPSNNQDAGDVSDDDFKGFQAYKLRQAIVALYQTSPSRIVMPQSMDDGTRYNFAIVLPSREDEESISRRMRQGIEDYFHVTLTREERLMDVYVLTSVDGNPPKTKIAPNDDSDSSVIGWASSVEFRVPAGTGDSDFTPEMPAAVGIDTLRGIFLTGTIDEFCKTLERALDRPVVNDAGFEGTFRFDLKASEDDDNNFLDRLRDELDLDLVPAQRRVEVVVVKPR